MKNDYNFCVLLICNCLKYCGEVLEKFSAAF